MAKCAGLSIRVSPSHPYNAGRAGLGWMSGYKCTLLAGMVLGIVFVTMLPDTVDDSSKICTLVRLNFV